MDVKIKKEQNSYKFPENKMKKTSAAIIAVSIILIMVMFPVVRAKAETLKIGFVADWEYGSKKKYTHKFPSKAAAQLTRVVSYFNSEFQPDLIVGGGDYVLGSFVKKKKAKRQLSYINQIFRGTIAPRLYCIGNHDLLKLTKEEVKQELGIDYSHSVTDIEGLRIITLDTNNLVPGKKKYGVNGIVSEEELNWLEEQLNTSLPVIVFYHHSPAETPEGKKIRINIIASERVRAALEKYGNVVAVFSGHRAINYQTEINGINYIVINNLTDKKALGSFAAISLDIDGANRVEVHVDQFGRKPPSYDFSKTITTD